MKRILIISTLFLFTSFFAPRTTFAQPACGRDGDVCTYPGSRSSCCTGYTCVSSGVPGGYTGVCELRPGTSCGDKGESCCLGNVCDGSFVCSSGNICVDLGEIKPLNQTKLYCDNKNEATNDPDITGKLYTAIGCIPIQNTSEFIGFILRWAIGIGGGIAFLLIVFAGFQIMTSAGNPERLKAGQELLTSAIAGLILLIFSVFILRIIGVDILNLPGFGG